MKRFLAGFSLPFALILLSSIADAGVQEKKSEEERSPIVQGQNQPPSPRQRGRGKRGLRKRLAEMDKNHDLQISRDEWTRKPKAFDRIDSNHDGLLTREELKAARDRRRTRDQSNRTDPNKPPQ